MTLEPIPYTLANGNVLQGFPSQSLPLVKLDFMFEAGPLYQTKLLTASLTNVLLGEASQSMNSQQVAEFMDFRGIILDRDLDNCVSTLSVYSLSKYLPELLPVLVQLLKAPAFSQQDFEVALQKKRQQFLVGQQKTSTVASRLFYQSIYGTQHHMGIYATLEDFDRVRVDDVKAFFEKRYSLGNARIVVSGHYSDEDLALIDRYFGGEQVADLEVRGMAVEIVPEPQHQRCQIRSEEGVQATIRVGRLLPMSWDSKSYARLQVLSTLLGGYFGARLMTNIREDKGYTYGIYSRTRIVRDSLSFCISTDVGSQYVDATLKEIYYELQRLCDEPVADEELDLVRKVMEGDFIRSVDGIFECSERYRQMCATHVTEVFKDNYFEAVRGVSPVELQQLAQQYLHPSMLTEVVAY